MSIEAINWVLLKAETLDPTETVVLLGLANHAQRDGSCTWPSISTLAGYSRISERTVQRTLRALEDRDVILRGDQRANEWKLRGGYRPVVYDLPMEPEDYLRPAELAALRGDNLTPLKAGRGDTGVEGGVTPVADKPSLDPSVVSYESADADRVTRLQDPIRIQPSTERQVKKRSTGPRRVVPAEESPTGSRTVGIRTSTERVRITRESRESISRPNSGGGLAKEFGQRAAEAKLTGPQQLNGAALARSLTRWMSEGNNPDSPDRIRSMFDRFFENPGGSEEYPLWRRFLSEAPKLRNIERRTAPTDWAQAEINQRKYLEVQAAAGDIRAENALSGANKPWLTAKHKESANNV